MASNRKLVLKEALSGRSAECVMPSVRHIFVAGLILAFYLMILYVFSVEKGWITWNLRFSQAGGGFQTKSFALEGEREWLNG